MTYEDIRVLNEQRKKEFYASLDQFTTIEQQRHKKSCKCRIAKTDCGFGIWIKNGYGEYLIELKSMANLEEFFTFDYHYIENISDLKKYSYIINNYEVDFVFARNIINPYFDTDLNKGNHYINTEYIKKVDNLKDFKLKSILLGYKVIKEIGRSICFLEKDTDIYIVSDCKLIVNSGFNKFHLNRLNCKRLVIENLDTSQILNMSEMFISSTCEEIILKNFDTTRCVDMSYMFFNCYNLKRVKLDSFNTKSVREFQNMFHRCNKLEELDLTHFDISNAKCMDAMFGNCNNLKKLNISTWVKPKELDDIVNMFCNCNKLENINIKDDYFRKMYEKGRKG